MKIAPSVVLLLISFVLTLYQANGYYGHYGHHENWNSGRRSGCYWISNCRECRWSRCTECDPGYNKYRGDCYRRCPGGLVAKKGTCSHRHPGCPYAFMRGCEICKSRWSCQKCAPGYLALKEPFQDEMRCVSRCPSGYKQQRNQKLKMDVCKFNRPCKLRGNCMRCSYSYRKCLDCDVGKVVKVNEDKTDISCQPVSEDCERHGDCVTCPGYMSCVTCALGFAPELAPGNKSMICKKIECIPNCADCRSENSCIRCSKGYYIYRPRMADRTQCVSECPSGYEARNDTFCPKCEKIQKCFSMPNCEECPSFFKCTRCSEGFALYKRINKWGYRNSCRKRCPRNYHKVLRADNKTLECKKPEKTTTTKPTQSYTTPEQPSTITEKPTDYRQRATSSTEQPTDYPQQATNSTEQPTDITEQPTDTTTENPNYQQNTTPDLFSNS